MYCPFTPQALEGSRYPLRVWNGNSRLGSLGQGHMLCKAWLPLLHIRVSLPFQRHSTAGQVCLYHACRFWTTYLGPAPSMSHATSCSAWLTTFSHHLGSWVWGWNPARLDWGLPQYLLVPVPLGETMLLGPSHHSGVRSKATSLAKHPWPAHHHPAESTRARNLPVGPSCVQDLGRPRKGLRGSHLVT